MSKFDIALKIKAKHGKLQHFIDKVGWTQADFARQIKVKETVVGEWFNLKNYPKKLETMNTICEMIGETPDKLFPEFLKNTEFLEKKKTYTFNQSIDIEYLSHEQFTCLPSEIFSDTEAIQNEVNEKLNNILDVLPEREKNILTLRFGL